jgi:TolB-like protein/AraC-like DNA-binding protein/Tfp pilus assembly protein PilF
MHKAFIQKLTNLVEANLANEKFGPEELAKGAGMSHSNLNRKLKTISNQNASLFIREVRLKKAKELLLNEDLTVAEISYRVGFGSPTYFNKCFHEYFGYAPGEMRNHVPENESVEETVKTIPKKRNRTKILIGIVVILVILVPSAYFLIKGIEKENIKDKSIAVLPFKYLSNDTLNQYLADGMMDAILMNLSKIKDLRVISRTSVEQYRKSDKTAATIGREQDVAYLLEGSFQKEQNQIRLIVQLIRVKDEHHVWSDNYDRRWDDIFTVQSDVAEKVADELQAAITPDEKQLIRKVPTINLTAYDFYQKGNEEYNKFIIEGNSDFSKIRNAEKYFLKALELDSTLALAYSGLAMTYYFKNRGNNFFSEDYLDSMLMLANKALSLDDQTGEAIRIRGNYFYETGKPEKAKQEYIKVLRLNPNDWRAYTNLGIIYKSLDDYVSSISNLHEAIMRNRGPELCYILNSLGVAYQNTGFIDKAKQCYEEKLALNNDSVEYGFHNVWLEYEIGNYEAAYKSENNTFRFNPNYIGNLTLSILADHDEESYSRAMKKIEWHKKIWWNSSC